MYALPAQTLEEALEDVRTACALSPSHISYYQLTLEPGTVFHARPPQLPDEDAAWQIQTAGQKLLAEAGYMQYEVSAYAREGARCRHNLNYWLFGDYLGIGAGAHGKISFVLPQRILRTVKPKQPREYQEQVLRASSSTAAAERGAEAAAAAAGETGVAAGAGIAAPKAAIGENSFIPPKDLPFEFMLNALRLNEGFTSHDYRRQTGLGMESVAANLAEGERRGLLAHQADVWRPTELGRRFLNDLQGGFLA
jgi:oxygen-independent coproporphyrinogen-3 oxidase